MKRTELFGEVIGPLASLRLVQTYSYTKEQCPKVLEARYRFPLPGDSAVTGVKVTFGDTEIRTELKDRQSAKDEYKEAKKAGRQAVMVTRESPDVFTICIAGIVPGEDVRIETGYVQLARPEGRGWSLRVPLTTVPRYVRKDEFNSRHAGGQPLMVLRDPGHRFALDLKIDGADSVESPTHRLKISLAAGSTRAELQQGEVIPDRDCVLRWTLKQETDRPTLSARVFRGETEAYFMAMIAPPRSGDVKKARRESIILVDHSGSMEGPKWEAADWAVERYLLGLGPGDTFALGVFHSDTKWYKTRLSEATAENVNAAIAFLKANKDSGGTELGMALEQALGLKKGKGDISRHLLLVTDAEVSDEGRILRLAADESKKADRRRISILCIDAAPNSFLALQLAEKGGGVAKFLTSSPEHGDISTALDSILEDWQQPVLTNCRLAVNGQVDSDRPASFKKGWGYVDLGDLPAGRTLWAAGKVNVTSALKFRLLDSRDREVALCDGEPCEAPALRSIFGSRKLLGLEFLIHSRRSGADLIEELKGLGYDPAEVLKGKQSKLYPENNQVNEAEALRNLIVGESLKYGIVSSETSFIAVSTVAGKKIEDTAIIANALADGWSEKFESCNARFAGSAQMPCKSMPVLAPSASLSAQAPRSVLKKVMQRAAYEVDMLTSDSEEVLMDQAGTMPPSIRVFEGVPQPGEETVLFDSASDGTLLQGVSRLDRLLVTFPAGTPEVATIDGEVKILIFVGDMALPRASVRLTDLIRQHGLRPLNIALPAGAQVKVVLVSPAGTKAFTGSLSVALGTQ